MHEVRGVQHELAYGALAQRADRRDGHLHDRSADRELSLVLLRDDLAFFPRYDAVFSIDAISRARARAPSQR